MALPSLATGRSRREREPVALVDSENAAPAPPSAAAGPIARIKAIPRRTQRQPAGATRSPARSFWCASAARCWRSPRQVLLARWMGSFQFGIYIYVWTWVLMIGALSDIGLSSAARRFIPEYTELKSLDRLRGFLDRQPLARLRHRHRDRRARRHRRDGDGALARSIRRGAALSRLPHHSDLRPGAGAGRHRAVL